MGWLFIHGVTIRQDRFDRLLGDVRKGLGKAGSREEVSGCYWGDLGRSERYTGASIPRLGVGRRATIPATAADSTAAETSLLELLLEDPLAELVALRDPVALTIQPSGFEPVSDAVVQRNRALGTAVKPIAGRVAATATDFAGPTASLDGDRIAVLVGDVVAAAAGTDRRLSVAELLEPMLRALVAGLYRTAAGEDEDLAVEFRWSVATSAVRAALHEQLGGQRGWIANRGAVALTFAMRHGLRSKVMRGLSLFTGDVLAWFANRQAILDRIDDAAGRATADGPLMLVGHSLGGVIALEYAVHSGRTIHLLATVGSQVGLFGELGVLSIKSSEMPLPMPAGIRAWRNLYDPDDALGFLAEPIFSDVQDVTLDTGAPFPVAHSEYWQLADTYDSLVAASA